ncbi:MAG TPA: YetF domain-containing protein [Gemmatimonadaceae bacterium]|nr:YetF domain-containing protein [Gemmatimonadaceae bacterium]
MDTVIRAIFVYVTLLVIFRISGRRTMASITTFDFVLTLIISEAIQQAMIDTDYSLTNAFLLVLTLISLDIGLSLVKQRSKRLERLMDGAPVAVMRDGQLQRSAMNNERVDEEDILGAARAQEGIERMDQIRHAVIEATGEITVVPKQGASGR